VARLLDKVCSLLALLAGLLLLFITFSIGYAIFVRQVKLPSPVWVVQFNEYALLWITFLATAWILFKGKHVSIQILTHRLSERGQKILELIQSTMGLGLCGIFCYFGSYTTLEQFSRKVINVQAVDVPQALVIMIIPIGFFLLSLQFLRKLIAGLAGLQGRQTSGMEGESPTDTPEVDSAKTNLGEKR
jgi:TRAP-type C4-dicarboxylate transport system permease small subunit